MRRCLTFVICLLFVTPIGCGKGRSPERSDVEQVSSSNDAHALNGDRSVKEPVKKSVKKSSSYSEVARAYFGEIKAKRWLGAANFKGRKNGSLILIVIDAFNTSHIGAYGYDRDTTPNIDKIAAKGLMAVNYISNSSWTRPSFTTIITGLTKRQHKMELNGNEVSSEIETIAERFLKAGYKTAGIVGNPLIREIWGFGQGYKLYEDTHSMGKVFPPDAKIAKKATTWLDSVGDDPFFLKLFLTAPHTPYRPISGYRKYSDMQKAGQVIEYPFREYKRPMAAANHNRLVAAYDDEISYADIQVGKIVAKLKQLGRDDDTAIIITADHGEMLGEHNCYQHAYHMWEQVLRVPFVMYAPWLKANGVYDDKPHTHIDLLPTALDLVALKHSDKALQGKSFFDDSTITDERVIFSQYNAHKIRRQVVRKGRWKLVHHHKVDVGALEKLNSLHESIPHAEPKDLPSLATDGERFEFYDLVADPKETKNLFKVKKNTPPLVELLDALGPNLTKETNRSGLSAETIEALTAAGYFVSESDAQPTKLQKASKKSAK